MTLNRSTISELESGQICLVGIPFDENSSFMRGPAEAPSRIVESIESDSANFFTESLTDLNQHPSVRWCGNAPISKYTDIEIIINQILEKKAFPFSLGGDHSITYPILKAIHEKFGKVHILHFDAHGDLYDELDGNRHSHACPFARIMEEPLASGLTQVGIRTLTAHQQEQAQRFGVNVIEMKDWNTGLRFEMEGPVYLSLDLDVLDPAYAPGVSHHEPGGFSTRELITMIQGINLNIIGCDVVEYNPARDINGVTGMVAAKLVKEIIDLLV